MSMTDKIQLLVGIVTVLAVIVGPILALYVQSWVTINRERENRKVDIFKTLMTTRAARLSPEHVRALNMIDVEFHRRNRFFHRETKNDKEVIQAWNIYRDHLNSPPTAPSPPPTDPKLQTQLQAQWESWNTKWVDLFVTLLHKIAVALDYEFDEVLIKKGIYNPEAFAAFETDMQIIRKALTHVLTGDFALKMDVHSFPVDEKILDAQKKQLELSIEFLEGKRSILVKPAQGEESTPAVKQPKAPIDQ